MWRPLDWDIMDYCSIEEQMESPLLAAHFFEAGADAMLEALFKLAENSPTKTFTIDAHKAQIYLGSESDDTP